jgi:hypothetical protein
MKIFSNANETVFIGHPSTFLMTRYAQNAIYFARTATVYAKMIRIVPDDPEHEFVGGKPPYLEQWANEKGPLFDEFKIRSKQYQFGGSMNTEFQKAICFCNGNKTKNTMSYISTVPKECECGFDIPVGSLISKKKTGNGRGANYYYYHKAEAHEDCYRGSLGTPFDEDEYEPDQKRNETRKEMFKDRAVQGHEWSLKVAELMCEEDTLLRKCASVKVQ